MEDTSTLARFTRSGGKNWLAAALQDARRRTLGLLAAYVAGLGERLAVPYSPQLNPQRVRGLSADPCMAHAR